MSACVSVIGPPASICLRNNGTTEPLEPSTLPKRTIEKQVSELCCARPCNAISATRLLAPMMFVGRTALSVLIRTKLGTLHSMAIRAVVSVPIALFRTPSPGLCSTSGTCLYAAAW
ncbi:hypothetical protein D9M72_630160 [compost metagenome]